MCNCLRLWVIPVLNYFMTISLISVWRTFPKNGKELDITWVVLIIILLLWKLVNILETCPFVPSTWLLMINCMIISPHRLSIYKVSCCSMTYVLIGHCNIAISLWFQSYAILFRTWHGTWSYCHVYITLYCRHAN